MLARVDASVFPGTGCCVALCCSVGPVEVCPEQIMRCFEVFVSWRVMFWSLVTGIDFHSLLQVEWTVSSHEFIHDISRPVE